LQQARKSKIHLSH